MYDTCQVPKIVVASEVLKITGALEIPQLPNVSYLLGHLRYLTQGSAMPGVRDTNNT